MVVVAFYHEASERVMGAKTQFDEWRWVVAVVVVVSGGTKQVSTGMDTSNMRGNTVYGELERQERRRRAVTSNGVCSGYMVSLKKPTN